MVDYTQACQGGTVLVSCKVCITRLKECRTTGTCSYTCPAPLPNSHLTLNACQQNMACPLGGVYCDAANPCNIEGTCPIPLPDGCKYDCDVGYAWDGVACVAIPSLYVKPPDPRIPFPPPKRISIAVIKKGIS